MVDVGDEIPEVTFKNEEGDEVRLDAYKGKKVLLAFYPFAFSPVCTEEFTCFHDDLSQFTEMGITVLGVSVDSPWANKAFKASLGVSFSLLSDFSKEAAQAFGVLRDDGFSERAYFGIDQAGKIVYRHVMDTPLKKLDNAALLAALG